MVVVSAEGEVLSHFSAGSVTLEGVDTQEEGALIFSDTITVPREPDSVTWIDNTHFATANEGDMDGGSRGWTIFNQDGDIVYDSGTDFEYAIVEIGHYPEERSGNKGVEPESVTFDTFNGTPYVFVGAERSSIVGVYNVSDPASPVLEQLLPSGIGPEGYVTIPERNLLVSANETDDAGARAHVMLFEYKNAPASYPHLTSAGMDELTGWGAISGQVMADDGTIYAVSDSFYGLQPRSYLAQLAGCELEFDTAYSCWRAQRNDDMLTSREDIYTVGDSAGIRGSRVAEIEGRLAGLHAAVALGNTTTADVNHERKRLLRHKRRFEKFQRQLSRLCGVRPGLAALVKPDTLVCRCEEIRWREAQSAIEHGAHDFRTLKVMTRIGMGMCQARFCWPAMTRLIANHTGADIATIGPARPRPPVRPVPVEVIAEAAEAETTG